MNERCDDVDGDDYGGEQRACMYTYARVQMFVSVRACVSRQYKHSSVRLFDASFDGALTNRDVAWRRVLVQKLKHGRVQLKQVSGGEGKALSQFRICGQCKRFVEKAEFFVRAHHSVRRDIKQRGGRGRKDQGARSLKSTNRQHREVEREAERERERGHLTA